MFKLILTLALLAFTGSLWAQSSTPPGSTPYPYTADNPVYLRGEKIFGPIAVDTASLNALTVNTNASINYIVSSNGMNTASIPWAGPTNTLPLTSGRQHFASPTACSVTGFVGKDGTNVMTVELNIKNTSATNWNFYLPAGVGDLNYVPGFYVVTNGTVLIWAVAYDPYLNRTNSVGRIAP
jgi:hypothetical protein